MQDTVRLVATIVVALGLATILWRELSDAADRRKVGEVRDLVEVFLPVLATVALLVWVWA